MDGTADFISAKTRKPEISCGNGVKFWKQFSLYHKKFEKHAEPKEGKIHRMKGQDKAPQGKQTAASVRRERVLRICCISLRILLILSTVLCVWITDIGCAWGWIKNARAGENWPIDFVAYGQTMIAAAALLTAGAVLVLLHRNRTALIPATAGITLCMAALYRVTSYAAESGFYSKIMEMQADALYRMEILPTWVAYGSLAVLAVLQHVSPADTQKRLARKRGEKAQAPPII